MVQLTQPAFQDYLNMHSSVLAAGQAGVLFVVFFFFLVFFCVCVCVSTICFMNPWIYNIKVIVSAYGELDFANKVEVGEN